MIPMETPEVDLTTVEVTNTGAFRQMLYAALEDASDDLAKTLANLTSRENPARSRVVGIANRVNRMAEIVALLDQIGLSDRPDAQDAEVVPLRVLAAPEGDGAA